MTRTFFKLSLLMMILFMLPLLILRAQHYDDSQLQTFLTAPEGCPAPCFLGVQPGVTKVSAGGDIMATGAGVALIRMISYQFYEVHFVPGVSPIQQARVYLLANPDTTVERINVFDTGLPLSRFFLAFGTPSRLLVYNTIRRNIVTFVAIYPDYGIYALVDLPLCSVSQRMLWDRRRDISIGVGYWREDAEQPDYYLADTDLNVNQWANQLRALKRGRCP